VKGLWIRVKGFYDLDNGLDYMGFALQIRFGT
jgi:hypothetical protein